MSTAEWPIGKRGRSVIVVQGEEDARQLAPILLDERPDPSDPGIAAVVAALPDLSVSTEELALEVRTAGIESVWLVVPASEKARHFCDELGDALLDAGLLHATYAPLPPDWQLTDILRELSPQRGLLYEILHTLWLAGGPHVAELKGYIKQLAASTE